MTAGATAEFMAPVQHSGSVSVWLLYAILGSLLLAFAFWRARRYLRKRVDARLAMELREQQLGMVLTASGCELWRMDLDRQLLFRLSYIASIGLHQNPNGEPASRFTSLVHPDDRQQLRDAFNAHVEGKSDEFAAVYRVRAIGGQYLWLSSHGRLDTPARGSKRSVTISGTTIDVTAMKTSELDLQGLNTTLKTQLAELREARAEIAAIEDRRKLALWGSGCEFFEADIPKDRLVRENQLAHLAANKMAEKLSGYWSYLHPDDLPQFNAGFVDHLKGRSEFFDVTYRSRRLDGRWAWIQTRGRIVSRDETGRATMIAGTNYDVSELKAKELQLQSLADELEHRVVTRTEDLSRALTELRAAQSQLVESEKMAALGALVAGVSHEINTPLGVGVTAASHLCERSAHLLSELDRGAVTKSALKEYAEMAKTSGDLVLSNLKRASELVRSFKQVAVDQSSEQRRIIALRSYLMDILSSLHPTLKRSRHEIALVCPEELMLDTYPGALYQITSNLLLNACIHAFPDAAIGKIEISASVEGEQVLIKFSDNGSGMTPEVRARVFEPFFTTRRGQGGSGLGLHIVYNLVTQVLNGRIEVESAEGEGTRFLLRIPGVVARPTEPAVIARSLPEA